jgi:hemerythrin superfamily protein
MDLYNLLRYDHETVKSLFREIEKTTPKAVKKREELFSEVNIELTLHALAEEKFLYPRLAEDKDTRAAALEAIEEHKLVKRLLKELSAMEKGTDEWSAKMKVLTENVEHHIDEEEEELFREAKKLLSSEETQEIADDIESFREDQTEMAGGTE